MRIESSSASVPDKRLSELYLRRARNELNLSVMVMKISEDPKLQMGLFSMPYEDTYFSAVISHAYYCIFYAAKSYLLIKGVKTKPPEEHRKTYEAIERLAKEGVIDIDLLKAYRELMIRAETS